jgi:DNA-binding GntR family transcriptional regulator
MLPVNGLLRYPVLVTQPSLSYDLGTKDSSLGQAVQELSLAPIEGRSASLADQVAAAVRAGMRSGHFIPGRLYSAYQLAEMLGVSRSPVREALMRLAEAGMVSLERNRGFRVVVPGAREIAEIFHLRLLLEVPMTRAVAANPPTGLAEGLRGELNAMRTAAANHDEVLFMSHDRDLHLLLLDASGNRRLLSIVNHLRDVTRLLGASTVDMSRSLADIAEEHEPVVRAIEAHDPEGAAESMAAHLGHTGRLLVAQAVRERGSTDSPEALWTDIVGTEGN